MAAISDFFDGMHGVIFPFGGSVAPDGFLMCDGSAVSRTLYAALFAVIGTVFGVGDGGTTFNVPDLRGRAIFGRDDMGGTLASRVTVGISSVDGVTIGAAGGDERIQQHSHGVNDAGHAHGVNDPGHSHTIEGSVAVFETGTGGNIQGTPTNKAVPGTEASGTGITIQGAGTGISIQNSGAGGSQNMPPSMIMNYVIKT